MRQPRKNKRRRETTGTTQPTTFANGLCVSVGLACDTFLKSRGIEPPKFIQKAAEKQTNP